MADARDKAFSVLKKVFDDKAYSNRALDSFLKTDELDRRDKAFVTNIVYGVLTHLKYLDYQIEGYSKNGLKKISQNVLIILRISLYQIIFMDKVPESAAVNEGVKLAKKREYRSAGFVNAILRSYLREGEKLPPKNDIIKYLGVKYSFPEYMVSMWLSRFGAEKCESILCALNEPPVITVRVNTAKITEEEFIKKSGGEKGGCPGAVILPHMGDISKIEGFSEGEFIVQDTSAQRAVLEMGISPSDICLDMCAAPGGKTTHMAEKAKEVVAWDIYEHKIKLIEDNAIRLSLSNIKAYVHNGKEKDESLFGKFDKVLLDAPCSGLGIIKKKPEIKWQRRQEDINEIVREQRELISAAAWYVKRGGVLLYSTCTINEEENEKIVEEFLGNNPDFSKDGEYINIFPKDDADGFFISKLKRN